MANLGVVIWNIEKFGAFSAWKAGADGSRIDGTLAAIALIVNENEASILIIQEYRRNGEDNLKALCKHLGGGWSYDYLPGAFNTTGKIQSFNDLQYSGESRTEGYAVLWNGDILQPFSGPSDTKMSRGRNGDPNAPGYINLVAAGAGPSINSAKEYVILPDGKGFSATAEFPISAKGPTAVQGHTPGMLRVDVARRASIIRVKGAAGYVPVIAYHAPAAAPRSLYGALCCALIREVGADTNKKVIVGGDFNLTKLPDFVSVRQRYQGDLVCINGTKTDKPPLDDEFAASQIQYEGTFQQKGQLLGPGDIYEHARDIFFYRNGMAVAQSNVIDVVRILRSLDSSLTEKMLTNKSVINSVTSAAKATDGTALPQIVLQDPTLMKNLLSPFTGGLLSFSTPLSSAVFYRCFISDHLPLYCKFDPVK